MPGTCCETTHSSDDLHGLRRSRFAFCLRHPGDPHGADGRRKPLGARRRKDGDIRRIDLQAGVPFSGGPATESVRPQVPRGEKPWRFGWQTPFLVSAHDPRTLYTAANVVFKSINRGAAWRVISPDLGEPAGGERAVVPYGSVTSVAESRFAP